MTRFNEQHATAEAIGEELMEIEEVVAAIGHVWNRGHFNVEGNGNAGSVDGLRAMSVLRSRMTELKLALLLRKQGISKMASA